MTPDESKDQSAEQTPRPTSNKPKQAWHWHPQLPLTNARIFTWPPALLTAAKELASYWFTLTGRVVILLTAMISWFFFKPYLATAESFELSWIVQIYSRNLALLIVFATGLHWYFYTWQGQGEQYRYDSRDMARNASVFAFGSQLKDNIFWSIVSGVTIWTLYDIAFMWGYANDLLWAFEWREHPVWFVAVFVLIPLWYSFYFYWIHRAEHWPPFFKSIHSVHHRNVNVGPWSGLSMHPVEHILYFGSVLIHLVIPSHPLHVIFHLQFSSLIAVLTHCGYDSLVIRGTRVMGVGYFFHQLHHRYFDCNYGTDEMPWDKWLGTFHDGTPEATARMRSKKRI